jgi:hypothetical protein
MGRKLRHGFLGAALAGAALLGGHGLYWRHAASELEAGLAAWKAARRAEGWRIAHGPTRRGGWPFAATLAVPEIALDAPLAGGLAWRQREALLRIRLFAPGALEIAAPGPQRLALAGTELPFAADRLSVFLPLPAAPLPREASFLIEALRVSTPAGLAEARSGEGQLELRTTAIAGEPAAMLAVELRGLALPMPTPLGERIAEARIEASLTGPWPGGAAARGAAEAWRDAGGTLQLSTFRLRGGAVEASGTATLALDEALQPMGAGALRVSGLPEALDGAVEAGWIGRRAGAQARAAALLLGGAGDGRAVELPWRIEARTLSFARLPLARLPPLEWPGAR